MKKVHPLDVRCLVLELITSSGSSHIGSCYSTVEILTTLYNDVLTQDDVFLLSKGHAAAALYSVLALAGQLSIEDLKKSYGSNSSIYMTHASHFVPGVAFSSGSLGMLSNVACGIGKAKQFTQCSGRIFVLLSDGELNEGSNWEAFMYAAHHKLNNVNFIIDLNGLQSLTSTRDTLDMSDLSRKFEAFGLSALHVNGHDCKDLTAAMTTQTPEPKVIIAKTVKGKGAALIENKVAWHYKSPSSSEYKVILEQLNA